MPDMYIILSTQQPARKSEPTLFRRTLLHGPSMSSGCLLSWCTLVGGLRVIYGHKH